MKKIMIAAAALVAMTACNKTLIESPIADSEYGYISLGITADTEMVETKVGNYENVANASNYNVMLVKVTEDSEGKKTESNYWSATRKFSDLSSPIQVPAGTYYFTAENQTINEAAPTGARGSMRLFGKSANVILAPGGDETATVYCDIANAMVTVAYEDDFDDIFISPAVKITDTKAKPRALSMEWAAEPSSHDDKKGVYYTADGNATVNNQSVNAANLKWILTANVNGVDKTFEGSFDAIQAYWNKITFKAGQNGKLSVVIKADTELFSGDVKEVEVDPLAGQNK